MICNKLKCDDECCIPEVTEVTQLIKTWMVVVFVLLLTSCGAVGYYLGGKAKAAEFNEVCQTGDLFYFKDYPGEYACFRIDVEE